MPTWTPEQREAIEARNHTILVSAAAGSGKTAVLVERITGILKEDIRIHLKNMMIVTFTRAAAGEMRQRLAKVIREKFAEAPEIFGQALDELENTQISTIHSFCQTLLREEFQEAQISPMFSVADDKRSSLLFDEAAKNALNALLEAQPMDENIAALTAAVKAATILEWNKTLYNTLMSMPAPFDWLHRQVEAIAADDYENQPWYHAIDQHIDLAIEDARGQLIDLGEKLKDPNAPEKRAADHQALIDYLEQWFAQVTARAPHQPVPALSFPRLSAVRNADQPVKDWMDDYKDARDDIKSSLNDQIVAAIDALENTG